MDDSSQQWFLVDTGAIFLVLLHFSEDPPFGPKLAAADGSPIACWGWQELTLASGDRHFPWRFLRAAVKFPIIGTDFLAHFMLAVDVAAMQLLPLAGPPVRLVPPPASGIFASLGVRPDEIGCPPSGTAAWSSPPAVVAHVGRPNYAALLNNFPQVVNGSKVLPEVKHGVEHLIDTTGRPVAAKYRRLDPARLAAAKKEFLELEKQGIVRRSSSQWASPLHMVRKDDGTWRPCGDFRRLNVQTVPDRYTSPNMADLTARLAGCTVFSKLDLRKGYHQVPVREADIPKTRLLHRLVCLNSEGWLLAFVMPVRLFNV